MMFKKGSIVCEQSQESAVIYSVTKMGGPVSMAHYGWVIISHENNVRVNIEILAYDRISNLVSIC